jgi:hypothetical protein
LHCRSLPFGLPSVIKTATALAPRELARIIEVAEAIAAAVLVQVGHFLRTNGKVLTYY